MLVSRDDRERVIDVLKGTSRHRLGGVVLTGVFPALPTGLLTFLCWAVTVSRQRSQGPPPRAGGQEPPSPAPEHRAG